MRSFPSKTRLPPFVLCHVLCSITSPPPHLATQLTIIHLILAHLFPGPSNYLRSPTQKLWAVLVKPVSDIQGSESLNGATIGAKSTSTWLATSLAADAYLHEVARVLRRGGVFFLVSLGSRHNREPLLSAVRDASGQACFVIDSEELFIAECSDAASTTPGHGDNSDTTKMSQQKSWRDDYHVYVIRRC